MGLRKDKTTDKIINKKNGTVTPMDGTNGFTFEAIEDIYCRILPLLNRRKEAGIKEGENETR